MKNDPKSLAIEYLDAVGKKDLARVEELLAPDLKFTGPAMARATSQEFISALKRLGAIHVRNDVKKAFADGNDVCVIYDFVTDTPAGALPTIEWLHFEEGRISSINLYYDRVPWKSVMDEISRRAAQATIRA
ncbi:MAG TPA: nuclear transport factor 2 family protein [Myxococcales bacterium]|nr:nuclear transport factor 2 family protein [Myxococcales bacterium]